MASTIYEEYEREWAAMLHWAESKDIPQITHDTMLWKDEQIKSLREAIDNVYVPEIKRLKEWVALHQSTSWGSMVERITEQDRTIAQLREAVARKSRP